MGKQLKSELENRLEYANNEIKKLQVIIANSRKIKNTENVKFNRFMNETLDPWLSNLIRFSFVIMTSIGIIFAIVNFGIDGKKLIDNSKKETIEKEIYLEKFTERVITKDTTILKALSDIQRNNLKAVTISLAKDYPKIKQNNRDVKLLKFIEHIFIYLIPILVFLGLYYYYSINYSGFLRNKGRESDDNPDLEKVKIGKAKDALQLTKSLFISSILAYTIIKVIEKVVLAESNKMPNTEILISYGVFILLLMGYLVFSHIGEHKKND